MGLITPTYADRVNGKITADHEPTTEAMLQQVGPVAPVGEQFVPLPAPPPPVETAKQPEPPVNHLPLKVALIGTAPSSRNLAPYNDPSWEIWACSPGNMNMLPRVTKWFELHANLLWPECVSYGGPYIEWLRKQTFPIYMQDQSLVPNAITFPREEMVKEFGKFFFTSSFAWMMALAIKMGAKEIALFGIDMASKDEYILQRAGGHYFMQLASMRGISVSTPIESDLAQPPPLYGYADRTPFRRKILARKKEITDRLSHMRPERDRLAQNITYLEGALEDLDYIESIWGGAQE